MSIPTLLELISKFNVDTKNYELAFQISGLAFQISGLAISEPYDFNKMYFRDEIKGDFIKYFLDAILDKQNMSYYVRKLLDVYGTYLKNGVALVAFTDTKKELKLIKRWCKNLSINFNKVKVKRYFEEYCTTHDQIVSEDDPCPQYWENEDCDIEYYYTLGQTKIVLHDDLHLGTFEELNFEWDDRYVDGGYVPDYK